MNDIPDILNRIQQLGDEEAKRAALDAMHDYEADAKAVARARAKENKEKAIECIDFFRVILRGKLLTILRQCEERL